VRGRVLEVGVGTGTNRAYLPAGIDYVGIEPDPHMRRRAVQHARDSSRGRFELVAAAAEAMPFADGTFDSVFLTVVLCSVDEQSQALTEIARALRPGGRLHYLEHVRPEGFRGRVMDIVTPAWSYFAGGCHPNRRTGDAIRAAGFVIESERQVRHAGLPALVGIARKAGADA
jgi:ubiquinone/menaquinone biosynthesis C-methylase UbiE